MHAPTNNQFFAWDVISLGVCMYVVVSSCFKGWKCEAWLGLYRLPVTVMVY
jgi:hypothetical protein